MLHVPDVSRRAGHVIRRHWSHRRLVIWQGAADNTYDTREIPGNLWYMLTVEVGLNKHK